MHFISGLPRSGSTLLGALLRQNPRFHAAMSSPMLMLCRTLHQRMSGNGEFTVFFDDERRKHLLQGLFDSYYRSIPRETIFDTNRIWTGHMALLSALFPAARVICCVREVAWIIDSLERQMNKHPLQATRIMDFKPTSSIYARVETLMNSENGLIGQAWSTLREAWFGNYASRLLVIPYESLSRHPQRTLDALYAELGEPRFDHDLDNLVYDEPRFDQHLGAPELHAVRPKVEYVERPSCLPPDIVAKYTDLNFWLKPALNLRGVKLL